VNKLFLGCVLLCCGAGHAAETRQRPSEADFLGDLPVVLSVSRLAQPLDETPGAVTVLDRETIRRSGAREVAELLRLVPGFVVSHIESGARPTASYHADYDAITRHLQVLVDGRPVYSSLLVGTANNGLMGVVLDDVERIEVLRGSNSASFGANAFLGVVNIVTRHAADTRGGMLALNAGQDGVRDGTARVGWGDDGAAFRLTAARRADGGFDKFYDDKRVEQAHLRGDLRVSPADELMLTAGHTDYRWGLPDVTARDESWRNSYANLQWTRQLDASDQLKFGILFDEERYDDFYPRLAADGVSRRTELEAQHTFAAGAAWRFVWGGQYRHEQVVSRDLFATDPDQQFHLWRVFGSAEWRPHPQWVVNAGGMWEKHGIVGASTAPRLMVHFHALPGHTLRAGATTAYKQPTLFELRTDWRYNGVPFAVARGGAEAERIDAREIGYLGEFRPLKLSVDLRVFREHVRDLLRFWRPCGGCANDIVNKDPNVQRGWETQWRWQPLADTQFLFNYAHLRLVPDAASSSAVDRYRAPPHVATLAWFQKLPAGFDFSLIHYAVGEYFYVRNSDRIPAYSQTDLHLARQFRIGATRAELALMVRAAGGGHVDFVERGLPEFHLDRRAHLGLRLEF
jgi:iron complex outermembrane receptor protein